MKQGANRSDLNKIAKLFEEGLNPKEISARLKIALYVVKNFQPEPEPAKKGAQKSPPPPAPKPPVSK